MTDIDTKTLRPVVVTTLHRGVFFGYAENTEGTMIRLEKARMCVYYSTDVKGMPGLASIGPTESCKVGLAVPAVTLRDITAVFECSAEAAAAWQVAPWC